MYGWVKFISNLHLGTRINWCLIPWIWWQQIVSAQYFWGMSTFIWQHIENCQVLNVDTECSLNAVSDTVSMRQITCIPIPLFCVFASDFYLLLPGYDNYMKHEKPGYLLYISVYIIITESRFLIICVQVWMDFSTSLLDLDSPSDQCREVWWKIWNNWCSAFPVRPFLYFAVIRPISRPTSLKSTPNLR